MLDVVVVGAGRMARDERREGARRHDLVDDGEDDQEDAYDDGPPRQGRMLGVHSVALVLEKVRGFAYGGQRFRLARIAGR